jgi:uncharacterized membrane protein
MRQNQQQTASITTTAQATISQYSGPIPDAETLAKYQALVPDAPERILKMAELQAEHRRALERKVIFSDARRADWGVLSAFLICFASLAGGVYLVANGHPVAGTIFAGAGLTSIAGTFIYGTKARKEERERREAQNRALIQR